MKHSLLALFLVACVEQGPTPEASGPSLAQAIYGGTQAANDPAVFGLAISIPGGQATCTATLIGQRTLLTAAHCAEGATEIWATNKTAFTQNDADYIEVTSSLIHSGWAGDPGENSDDLALLLLKNAVTTTPKQWNMQASNVPDGKTVRMVGYGVDENGNAGTKKQSAQVIDAVTTHLLHFDQRNGHGVCQGDSGGPVFSTGADGVERVVGVASFVSANAPGQDACAIAGAHTRVDVYSSWITAWMVKNETPTCARDGLCKQSCTTPDLDCTCAADGQCTTACADPSFDPDCGANCGADGVCSASTDVCPAPDVDCKAQGALCTKPTECPGRVCTNDAQHKATYCSVACSAAVACPSGFECMSKVCRKEQQPEKDPGEDCEKDVDYCTAYTVCAGKPATCVEECASDDDCTEDKYHCPGKDGALEFCVASEVKDTESKTGSGTDKAPAPAGTAPTARTPEQPVAPAAGGCSSARPSNAWLVLACFGFILGRRRRV